MRMMKKAISKKRKWVLAKRLIAKKTRNLVMQMKMMTRMSTTKRSVVKMRQSLMKTQMQKHTSTVIMTMQNLVRSLHAAGLQQQALVADRPPHNDDGNLRESLPQVVVGGSR